MPILIPEKPAFPNDRGAEKKVWSALRDQLPDDAVLVQGLRLTRRTRDHEGDLIVLWPDRGVAVIEVKGGHLEPNVDGTFTQSNAQGASRKVDPFEQARTLMYDLIGWFRDKTSINPSYTFAFLAALPFTRLADDWHSTRAVRLQAIDKRDLANAASRVEQALLDNAGVRVAPSEATIMRMVKALEAKIVDAHDPVQLAQLLDERAERVADLLQVNQDRLDFVRDVRRFHVTGPAGTGKTAMAVTLARRLTGEGQRVLFVCYTALLAADLKRREEREGNRKHRIAAISTLHALGPKWGVRTPSPTPPDYWEVTSPALIRQAADAKPVEERFDAIIVDEGQDFSPAWGGTVVSLLRDRENGRIHVFSDSGQTVFDRGGGLGFDLVPLVLSTNLRNTQEISAGANHLTASPADCIGPEGPDILYCEVPEWADVTKAGDSIADSMLNHFRPADIVVLQTHHRHPELAAWDRVNRDHYIKRYFEDDDLFYCTVKKFKGLERHCVVLVVDGFLEDSLARELLYVGMTRAQDLLIVVSRRSTIEPHVDAELMAALDSHPMTLADDEYEVAAED